MSTLPRICLWLAVLAVFGPGAGAVQAQKAVSRRVDFETADGVVLKGTMYPAQGDKKREAVVLLLHDFHKDKGGSSKKEGGWLDLAIALQQDGYPVLSFDFRGYGDSTEVVKEKFWSLKNRHNLNGLKLGAVKKKGGSISYKDFSPTYFPHLMSDVAAARAYLERRNDAKDLNCSSIIVIGAGDGATAGAGWMYNEARRRRDKSPPPFAAGVFQPLPRQTGTEAESKDLAGAVWLSISGSMGGKAMQSAVLPRWTAEVGKRQGVPIAFLEGNKGKENAKLGALAKKLLDALKPQGTAGRPKGKGKGKGKGDKDSMKMTGIKNFSTLLYGEKLLDTNLSPTSPIKWIKEHLAAVMEERGNKEAVDREVSKARFLYTYAGKDTTMGRLNKDFNQDAPLVDLDILFK